MSEKTIPFWAVSSGSKPTHVPSELFDTTGKGLSANDLDRLRRVLAAWSDETPLVLERYPVEDGKLAHRPGQAIAAASPLMVALGEMVGAARTATPSERSLGTTEILYRLVVPREIAEGLSAGSLSMMQAADGSGAIRGSVLAGNKIVAGAKFLPTTVGGTAATTTGGAGAAAATGASLAAAGPLLVLLAATAMSVYAEEQRRIAIARLQESIDDLKKEMLGKEADALHGAAGAIIKATALLADEGRLGMSLGIGPAVHAVDTAVATAERRISEWERRLAELSPGATPDALVKAFPGIDTNPDGDFIPKIRMAALAIAMKRRVAVLQATEHIQLNSSLTLRRFTDRVAEEARALNVLEQRLTDLLNGLASLPMKPPDKVHDVMFSRREVRRLLSWAPGLQRLAQAERPKALESGALELSLVVGSDGSARVLLPATLPT